jgi:hypothetical protein
MPPAGKGYDRPFALLGLKLADGVFARTGSPTTIPNFHQKSGRIWNHSRPKLNGNNLGCRIQTPQVIRIACNYGVSLLPGEDYHRCIDNIRRIGGATELSTGTGKLLVKRNNLNFVAPQEPG